MSDPVDTSGLAAGTLLAECAILRDRVAQEERENQRVKLAVGFIVAEMVRSPNMATKAYAEQLRKAVGDGV